MPESAGHRPALAIDLGATKILAAIVSEDGEIIVKERHPTMPGEGPSGVIARIISASERLLSQKKLDLRQISGISIAAAGAIDIERGIVTSSPNLPGWRNIALRDILRQRFGTEIFLIHDASAAALAELHFGAGKGAKDLVYVTVSTGIGGGIIINGELYSGSSGSAGEIGHMTIDINGPRCNCGNIGCLEMLASGTAVAREAIRRIGKGEKSSVVEMVKGEIENITAETIGIAAGNGDALALDVISKAATYLGTGLVNLVNILNPEMIIIGGGMAKLGDLLLEPGRKLVRDRAFAQASEAVRIVTARLGDDSGVVGAAIFARQNLPRGRQQ